MRKALTFLFAATALLAASGAQALASDAAKITGVVELFTSQGCSSCPPADRVLTKLSKRDDVLALAYHVDYWDYLGWKDTLASPDNTARQYAYRATLKNRSVYTPQAVVNGRTHMNGGDGPAIDATLDAMAADGRGLNVPVSLSRDGSRISVTVGASDADHRNTKVMLVYFREASPVTIARGENAGLETVYANAVTSVQTIGMWDGREMTAELPVSEISDHEANGCAVLVQSLTDDGKPGPVIGAAILPRLGS